MPEQKCFGHLLFLKQHKILTMQEEEKEIKITKVFTKPNGPIIITGEFEYEDEAGNITKEKRIALCRCAQSGAMPFCDGSHNRCGFLSK